MGAGMLSANIAASLLNFRSNTSFRLILFDARQCANTVEPLNNGHVWSRHLSFIKRLSSLRRLKMY